MECTTESTHKGAPTFQEVLSFKSWNRNISFLDSDLDPDDIMRVVFGFDVKNINSKGSTQVVFPAVVLSLTGAGRLVWVSRLGPVVFWVNYRTSVEESANLRRSTIVTGPIELPTPNSIPLVDFRQMHASMDIGIRMLWILS